KTASKVFDAAHRWGDADYMRARAQREPRRRPLNIYEVHLGSWARVPEQGLRPLTYRELADKLVPHLVELGCNAVELLPIAEHPFGGSWGYQVSGYFAPTSRFGDPDDFRAFVDSCHANDIAVILDWVPAHFPKDGFALARFDGTALYEHEDPRRGEHPDWGTLIFNFGRTEVRNFLIANALFWLESFHIDGLRVDAVASMLYLDYSRKEGAWLPNAQGGREDFEAVHFLQELNETIRQKHPDAMMIAEESTAWPGVTQEVRAGGLGFTFKWNMGWMHDTLKYFAIDPVHRRYHQDQLTFAMVYEHSERFIMPLSHDEVVHGKGSLVHKMPGDAWQKFANLRALYAYQFTRPGKKLLFMGSEIAIEQEWDHDHSIPWHQGHDPLRRGLRTFVAALGKLYLQSPPLWQKDPDGDGFFWIDHHDHQQSVLVYGRRGEHGHLIVALNLTPVPRLNYRIGVPHPGAYRLCLSSDDTLYGGSGVRGAA
ncbi:MAG: 1,4-alpha-glucan branching protein GlgB, partial [Deltaproteobacteria bacterium]